MRWVGQRDGDGEDEVAEGGLGRRRSRRRQSKMQVEGEKERTDEEGGDDCKGRVGGREGGRDRTQDADVARKHGSRITAGCGLG